MKCSHYGHLISEMITCWVYKGYLLIIQQSFWRDEPWSHSFVQRTKNTLLALLSAWQPALSFKVLFNVETFLNFYCEG